MTKQKGNPSEDGFRILAVHYSQSGQLTEILDQFLEPFEQDERVRIDRERIRPQKDHPFPWTAMEFFDAFPESVQEIPMELEPFSFDPDTPYDLIVLAYQPWFLSPSIPTSSFLQSPEGKEVMKNTPVITISGSRNMWICAQEKVKRRIDANKGRLVGNIALVDPHSNLVSLGSILGWMFKGKREGFLGIFPRAGVPEADVDRSSRFGEKVLKRLPEGLDPSLQDELLEEGAVRIEPNLMVLEKRGSKAFEAFSKFVRKKGGPGEPRRKNRLRLFIGCLFPVLIVLSPITTVSTYLILLLKRKRIRKDLAYHSGVLLEI